MSFLIKLEENTPELQFLTPLKPEHLSYQVFPTAKAATGDWGTIIFQVMATPDFSICYVNHILKKDVSFIIQADKETIELQMAHKNDLDFELSHLGKVKLKQGQFNLIYLPVVCTRAHFKAGEYISVDIAYKKQYLQRFIPHLPALREFLENTENNIACQLSLDHHYASHKMIDVIKNVLQYEYEDDLSGIYIECKMLELLTLAITKMSKTKDRRRRFVLADNDIEMFNYAKHWLTDNVDNPGSLSDISKRFGINEFKLKKGFKELYGVTVFEHLLKVRLERARQQLLSTDLLVAEIAYRAGYSNHNHFTVAFKKYFNYSPNFLRKK